MASNETDDLENDWTFVDSEGKIDIEPRKNSVTYSKPLPARDAVFVSPTEVPAKDDSEGEAEFEVLSGFQCHPPTREGLASTQDLQVETNDLSDEKSDICEEVLEGELVPVQQNGCQCAADDGIMIISNHFCVIHDTSTYSAINDDVNNPVVSDCERDCSQENLPSSNITLEAADDWENSPQLSKSGSYTFPSDLNSSEEENDIEPIPEEDSSQEFVELSHEADTLDEMADSKHSLLSFDSNLFNPGDLDEGVGDGDDHSYTAKLSDAGENYKERDRNEEDKEKTEDPHVTTGSDNSTSVHFDVPTLFVLLGVTTALGFSIGYGLSVYISSQALVASGNIKRPGPKTTSLPFSSDSMEPLDEVSGNFLDQLRLRKLEDRLDSQKVPESENELGDLFDTKALHEKLQQKHFKLMSIHESLKQRLRLSKVMSWYWRLKYEEEKSKKEGGGEWNKALQEQLEHMEQLYMHEKHTADLWRRMNENAKLRRAVANGIKFDKYWKDFLSRWKKAEDKRSANESQTLTHSSEVEENPEVEELSVSKPKEPEQYEHCSARGRENMWRDRWIKDVLLKGHMKESSSKSEKGASDDSNEKNYLSVISGGGSLTTVSQKTKISPWYSPVFMESSVKKPVEDTSMKPDYQKDDKMKTSVSKHSAQSEDKSYGEEILKYLTRGPQFDNPLFPRQSVSWFHDKAPRFLIEDPVEQVRLSAENVSPKETYLQVYWCPVSRHVSRTMIASVEKTKADKKRRPQDVVHRRSFIPFKERGGSKGEKESAVQSYGALKTIKIRSRKNEENVQLQRLLSKQKQMLRNLSKDRGEEIRMHRIQRRELKKKEKAAKLRAKEADRYLLDLKQERRRLEIEKRKLRRSWKALKRSKKKFSVERKLHEKDKEGLKKFTAALQEEKNKLKKLKVRLKKMKKLLAKQSEMFKLKKKSLDINKKKEVERLRTEIAQEKDKLRKQQRVLKSLKKAAKDEYKKWSEELRKMKTEKEKMGRKAEKAKERRKGKKKLESRERERQREQEYESFIREQVKDDKEKRRRKGESNEAINEKVTNGKRKKNDDDTGREDKQSRGSQGKTEGSDRRAFFRQQLEKVKEWLSNVRKKTLERRQKTYAQMENLKQWLSSVHKKTLKKAEQFHWRTFFASSIFGTGRRAETPTGNANQQADPQETEINHGVTSEGDKKIYGNKVNVEKHRSKLNHWEFEKREVRKLMSGIGKREYNQGENVKREMAVRNSELAKISENRALAGFSNLTFDVDLVKTFLKGLDKLESEDKKASSDVRAADTRSFIIISKESEDMLSSGDPDAKKEKMDKKTKFPKGHPWTPQERIESEDDEITYDDWSRQEMSEGPIPPKGFRLSPEEWYEKRHEVKAKRQKVPRGPVLSDMRWGEEKARDRLRGNPRDKVCTSDDAEKEESIPAPDWVFQRARERAKERADQWRVPWYDLRAKSRNFQRSTDEHNTHFPCGHNWELLEGDRNSPSWYDQWVQDRCYQRSLDEHITQFLSDKQLKRHKKEQSVPWYDRRAQERHSQRSTDNHKTQFPCGRKGKRGQSWFFERASDRARQRSNHVPWYFRRAEGRQSQRRQELDPWFFGPGHYRDHLRDWIPKGPCMNEHC